MTRQELARQLAALRRRLDARVDVAAVIVAADGEVLRRVHRGWIEMPADCRPPSIETLLGNLKRD